MTAQPIGRAASVLLPDREPLHDWMSRISWGRAVTRLQPAPGSTVVALPLHELVTVDGRAVHSRIRWDAGTVIAVLPDTITPVTWSHTDRSHDSTNLHATITVTSVGELVVTGDWPHAALPVVPESTRSLIDAGRIAEWEMLTALEPFVHHQLECVSNRIATELGADTEIDLFTDASISRSVVDGLTIDTLAAGMLYGEAHGEIAVPAVTQLLIHRYADGESCALRVPLCTYLHRNIIAQAFGRIRGAIGDSMLGPRIRRVAATLPRDAPAEAVLRRCRELKISGREPLGIQRVRDALAVPLQVAARATTLSILDVGALADSESEAAFDQVDELELVRAYRKHSGISNPDMLWLSWEFEVEGRVSIDRDQFWCAARRLQLADQ